jgi:hypothetical protein
MPLLSRDIAKMLLDARRLGILSVPRESTIQRISREIRYEVNYRQAHASATAGVIRLDGRDVETVSSRHAALLRALYGEIVALRALAASAAHDAADPIPDPGTLGSEQRDAYDAAIERKLARRRIVDPSRDRRAMARDLDDEIKARQYDPDGHIIFGQTFFGQLSDAPAARGSSSATMRAYAAQALGKVKLVGGKGIDPATGQPYAPSAQGRSRRADRKAQAIAKRRSRKA